MDTSVRDIVEYLKNLGYTLKHLWIICPGYYFETTPPEFPIQGLETKEQVEEYLKNEIKKVLHLVTKEYKIKTYPHKDQYIYFSIKHPKVRDS